jgi:tetratricopeptide (TPR) repeat protein/DNA-binding transcriptional ArsR family regulator
LLGIASTFDEIFPRTLLLEITGYERLPAPASWLDTLIVQRYLLTGDEGEKLWLSPILRRYIYELQNKEECRQRHRRIAAHYEREHDALAAARHWQRAGDDGRAIRVLMPAVPELIHELQLKELVELLQQFEARRLDGEQWYRAQLLLSDLLQRAGQFEETLAACRRALQATDDPDKQARVYRRMGKLYESRNQAHALRYYQQAVERFASGDPELAELLKDRGWLYFYRQEWEKAKADLQQALDCAPPQEMRLQADILDAMANLARVRGELERALSYAERALALREEEGDLLAIAKSLGNLGFLYRAMKEYRHAILAHQEALATYQKLGNRELMAAAWLNMGAAHFHGGDLEASINAYRQSLEIGKAMQLPLIELKAHYNLAEALAATGQQARAIRHWNDGYRLCQEHNFGDQAADFLELAQEIGLPVDLAASTAQSALTDRPLSLTEADEIGTSDPYAGLSDDEALVIELARREQNVTARRLMIVADISRATATRRLTALAEKGLLIAQGQGRGAYYSLTAAKNRGKERATIPSAEGSSGAFSVPLPVPSSVEEKETVRALLQNERATLERDYGITSLGILPGNEPVRIIVRFTQTPDLAAFFHLRINLASLLHLEVDLLPEFVLSSLQPASAIEWIW